MKALKTLAGILMIPALLITFSKADDSALWIQFLCAGYTLAYVLIKFRGTSYE